MGHSPIPTPKGLGAHLGLNPSLFPTSQLALTSQISQGQEQGLIPTEITSIPFQENPRSRPCCKKGQDLLLPRVQARNSNLAGLFPGIVELLFSPFPKPPNFPTAGLPQLQLLGSRFSMLSIRFPVEFLGDYSSIPLKSREAPPDPASSPRMRSQQLLPSSH